MHVVSDVRVCWLFYYPMGMEEVAAVSFEAEDVLILDVVVYGAH